MKGFLFLLYCIEILGAVNGAQSVTGNIPTSIASKAASNPNSPFSSSQTPTIVANSISQSTTKGPTSHAAPPLPGAHRPTTKPFVMFYRKEYLSLLMVTGGLIIACAILLFTTLLLIWKVCKLSRRIKMLSSNADLISTSEYWVGTAKRNKSASEKEDKETTVLMSDIIQTQEDIGNGTTKEEGKKVNEGGQKGEENKKEAGDPAKSEEASTAPETVD
ncbi:uncharacterized protein LOC115019032 [Cottoperca gobio]|uniref:Uncharacterized protein LOC115019032 n=1 Tax=Cottoperca gobio TaxID=56716 RepID=A0A6J2R1Q2_COTGO|nr:uncharacterized protein LOC115019032 [Cottoperca gobio]